tara:strand:+ start:238 stop:444 length:207 start_codon:yes stop_codon:yes gene_type:complete
MTLLAVGGGFANVMERLVPSQSAGSAEFIIAGPPIPFPQSYYLMSPKPKQASQPVVNIFENWLRDQFV